MAFLCTQAIISGHRLRSLILTETGCLKSLSGTGEERCMPSNLMVQFWQVSRSRPEGKYSPLRRLEILKTMGAWKSLQVHGTGTSISGTRAGMILSGWNKGYYKNQKHLFFSTALMYLRKMASTL